MAGRPTRAKDTLQRMRRAVRIDPLTYTVRSRLTPTGAPLPPFSFKKGLPLSCYPLRNGMVLPPGATLPPSVVVPPGMNIIIQPLNPSTGVSGSLVAGGAESHPLFAGGYPRDAAAPPSPAVLISDK